MDPREMETLIQRLVANPHDEEALAYAHHAGTTDPRSYALLLEKVGQATPDPAYAAHWLSEAANVWSTTIGDAHHAARTLMIAIDKDPTQRVAADRLADLYREKGDTKALVALLERLVKSLGAMIHERPEVREQLAALHDELGRLWGEPPLSRPERALENWRRLTELDPQNTYAIYAARELLKSQQQFAEALPFFEMEQVLVDDPERKLALYRDEADIRVRAGDGRGATEALRKARALSPEDPALIQEVGASILDRMDRGEPVAQAEREEATQLFVGLAETYDGDYGLSYAITALRGIPGHDRAMQLADHYAKQLGRTGELRQQYAAYLAANPTGYMAEEARTKAGSVRPGAPPGRSAVAEPRPPIADHPSMLGDGTESGGPDVEDIEDGYEAVSERHPGDVTGLIEDAQAEAKRGRRSQALAKFREVLQIDPANGDALSWVEEHLRQRRMYADLRDVLLAASKVTTQAIETRKSQLRDVAGLCESQLRDLETAIQAYKQISQLDRGDEQARDQLRRLLERGARWDDLAVLLEQEAMSAPDTEQKIGLEKKLAQLQEQKRKDPAAAAEAWARIAGLDPQDESAIQTAVKFFEKAELLDSAAQVIADNVGGITDTAARGGLLQKLGELRLKMGDSGGGGDALAEAAEALGQPKLWEQAEKAYMEAARLVEAANALEQRALLTDAKLQAPLFAQAAELLLKVGDPNGAIDKLEQACQNEPTNDQYAQLLEEQYRATGREADLVSFLLSRGDKLADKGRRIAARKAAAELQRSLGDVEGARESLLLVLSDGDDADALLQLVDDAESRTDFQTCADLLRRLGAITQNREDKLGYALREAAIVAGELEDLEGGIARYETIYQSLDPKSRQALAAIADLEERRGNLQGAADALERELPLSDGGERVDIAQRLAQLYEGELDNPKGAIKALEIVHQSDPEDFDAVARLQVLCERVEDWQRVAQLMATLIEVEGDEDEASSMTRRLADILHGHLDKGDEALAALERLADGGDEACRKAYVELGDRLGWKGVVATKLVAWNESAMGPDRNEALRGAFERFLEVGREADAARVAVELARSKAADEDIGARLEQVATRLKDLDALAVAHDIMARDLAGPARASELVRQAEVQVAAGVDPLEAMQHGESALTSVAPGDVEPLLTRLAALTDAPGHIIDLYERQVGRCRAPADRLAALARAAQVAAERGAKDRARSFFELALSGGVQEDTLAALEDAARTGDEHDGTTHLRFILAEALAAGGQGSRDGGRTRAALLRRAATIAHQDLRDIDRAFGWLGDALITHVDDATLEALFELGDAVGDVHRVESTLGRALEEVFDGPLVRKLLARRAKLRREALGDRKGASIDLKKLHDLSPSDQEVMNELSALLLELGDHRGMIQLYEDQILRGRDPGQRAELARKVARLWEEEIGDAREAADAWRRVLRMKAGDAEAQAGLDRAKAGKLKRPPPPPKVPGGVLGSEPPTGEPPPSGEPRAYAEGGVDEISFGLRAGAFGGDERDVHEAVTSDPVEASDAIASEGIDAGEDIDSTTDQAPAGLDRGATGSFGDTPSPESGSYAQGAAYPSGAYADAQDLAATDQTLRAQREIEPELSTSQVIEHTGDAELDSGDFGADALGAAFGAPEMPPPSAEHAGDTGDGLDAGNADAYRSGSGGYDPTLPHADGTDAQGPGSSARPRAGLSEPPGTEDVEEVDESELLEDDTGQHQPPGHG
jgi:cellulose synthase operon protein C